MPRETTIATLTVVRNAWGAIVARRGITAATVSVGVAAVVGAVVISHRGPAAATTHLATASPPALTPATSTSLEDTTSVVLTTPSAPVVTAAPPTVALTAPKPVVTAPRVTTTLSPPTTLGAAAPRPPCPGQPSGYGGYGCTVTKTDGRITATFEAYGQILQVNRDPVQQRVQVTDAQGGYLRTVRFDHGDGTSTPQAENYACGGSASSMGGSDFHTYGTTGLFQVTVEVTTSLCQAGTGPWIDDQTLTITIPVRVCQRIDVVNGDVRCTVP